MSYVKRLRVTLAALILWVAPVQAETDTRLVIAIGEPGSDSFAFGTELWALSQIALMPKHRIGVEAREVAADEDRLALLGDQDVQAALVYGQVPRSYREDMRTIMALWPRGVVVDEVDPVQFLVRRDISEDVIYLLTRAMFEHVDSLRSAHDSLGIGLPSEAMTGLGLPLHPGAYRYYQERGFGPNDGLSLIKAHVPEPAQAAQAQATEPQAAKSITYTDFDDDDLDEGEIAQIVAACRHALDIGSLSPVLGDLSHTGCEAYMAALVDGRPAGPGTDGSDKASDAVSTANDGEPVLATSASTTSNGDIDVLPFEAAVGQGGPAVLWDPTEEDARPEPGPTTVFGSELKPPKMRIARQPVM